jgi:hypothetical protein
VKIVLAFVSLLGGAFLILVAGFAALLEDTWTGDAGVAVFIGLVIVAVSLLVLRGMLDIALAVTLIFITGVILVVVATANYL